MNVKRLFWLVSLSILLVPVGWFGTQWWQDELQYRFREQPPALAAAVSATPAEYVCPKPPSYHRVEDRLNNKRTKKATVNQVLDVWTEDMAMFCNRKFLKLAASQGIALTKALDEDMAISLGRELSAKLRGLAIRFKKAKKDARVGRQLKAMWIDGKWPSQFLKKLKRQDPVGYELLHRKSTGN